MPAERTSALLKGVLDLCVLALLADRRVYGYELASQLRDRGLDVGGGSIYPLLARLERAGDVRAEAQPSSSGPPRRYWTLTASGRATLASGRGAWQQIAGAVTGILEPQHPQVRERGGVR